MSNLPWMTKEKEAAPKGTNENSEEPAEVAGDEAEKLEDTEAETIAIPDPKPKRKSASKSASQHAKVMEFLQNMPSVSSTDRHYNLSVYGPRGSGKSTFACGIVRCIPTNKSVFYVDVEGSHIALLNKQNPVYPHIDRIKGPYKPKDFEEFRQIVETMAKLPEEENPMGAVVIDTVGEVSEDTVTEVLQRNISKGGRNPYLSSEHEYRERNERMRRVFKTLRDMPIHVVLIAHENDPDPDKGIGYRPQLSPTVLKMVENNCDIQIHLIGELQGNTFNGVAEITAGSISNSSLKTRIMGLPPKIKNPKMEDIFAVAKPTRSTEE